MPNTQPLKCGEHLVGLKPRQCESRSYRYLYNQRHLYLTNPAREDIYYWNARSHNYLQDAVRLHMAPNRYESAFVTVLSRAKCKFRKPRNTTIPFENLAAIRLLNSWLRKPEAEHNETWERLEQSIDDTRLSTRKFFT